MSVMLPDLPAPTAPQREVWTAALDDLLVTAGEPTTFVCHSLGCWAVDHLLAERGTAGVHAALLVTPPSPYLLFEPVESFLPPPRQRQVWAPIAARTLLVGSDNDEFTTAEEFREIAAAIGVECRIIPNGGHLNLASGFGPWPFALDWLRSVGAL